MTARGVAPGRVNLIGEHTDYNEGYVLPIAIPQQTVVEATARSDDRVIVRSTDMTPREVEYRAGSEAKRGEWVDYLQGTTWALREAGHAVGGFEATITSQVPVGSGLSSSAALEIAALRCLRSLFGLKLDDRAMVSIAHRAETGFVGVPVGILDQMACSFADEDTALFLDTRTLEMERVPLPAEVAVAVIDSGERHENASSGYRTRRAECEEAARRLGVAALRDVEVADLPRVAALPAPLDRRARHVVTEDARVLEAVAALEAGDAAALGRLFDASHASMRDDYECSTPGIDRLVALARSTPGVLGARLTGGGFGGSIVMLVDPAHARDVAERVARAAGTIPGLSPRALVPR